uniref:Uncharacterized protein n=1 Tax=Arundo donax TaxID=35708 RepID=A0A0A9S2E6_ARUDO
MNTFSKFSLLWSNLCHNHSHYLIMKKNTECMIFLRNCCMIFMA